MNVNEVQNHVRSLLLHKYNKTTAKTKKMLGQTLSITSSHFLTRTRFHQYACSGLSLACAAAVCVVHCNERK